MANENLLKVWDFGTRKEAVEKRLQSWKDNDLIGRIWRKDATVWSKDPMVKEIGDRLGWLHSPEGIQSQLAEIGAFAQEIQNEKYHHVVLLGMGGSSLAPAVFQDTFGNSPGCPVLKVLDSTHPAAIGHVAGTIDPLKTLFIVSSKSGTTLETLTLFYFFWNLVSERTKTPGRNFAAITDPGTPLAELAKSRQFRRTFLAPSDIGGRYSALSAFGLVPAALIGIDIGRLLGKALRMAESCASNDPFQNPGILLGAALSEFAIGGRDKVTLVTGASLSAFPLWLEQLIAESTGKNDKGLIPVAGEALGSPDSYGQDRVFVGLSLEKSGDYPTNEMETLRSAGHPVLPVSLAELADLGQEFFRWEMAVVAAGAAFGIHPFDQPDVQLAKDLARKAMESTTDGQENSGPILSISRKSELKTGIEQLLKKCGPGTYVAFQAYLSPDETIAAGIEFWRNRIRDQFRVASTVGFGPRFLHSTGQLHKGGPDTGLFVQLVDTPPEDLVVPEKGYTFGRLIRAQAEGDYQALQSRGRRVIRIHLGENAAQGLAELLDFVG
jgi:transaldolase / glucose-6-phosphate isomerase